MNIINKIEKFLDSKVMNDVVLIGDFIIVVIFFVILIPFIAAYIMLLWPLYIYRVIQGGAMYIYTYKGRRLEKKLKAQKEEEAELELFIEECLEPTKSLLARVHNDVSKLKEHNYGNGLVDPVELSNFHLRRRLGLISMKLNSLEREFIDECKNNKKRNIRK